MKTIGTPFFRWLIVGFGMIGVIGAVVYVTEESRSWLSAGLLLFAIAVLAFVLATANGKALPLIAIVEHGRNRQGRSHESLAPLGLLIPALAMVVITAATADNLTDGTATDRAVAVRWVLSLALLLVYAWWYPLTGVIQSLRDQRRLRISVPPFRVWALWVGIIIIAAVPRLALLNRYPTVIGGDEGQFMLIARAASEGTLPNPFGTGFFSTPNLYLVAQGWLAELVGPDLAGHRLLSAVVGVVGVVATWRLGRYLVGPGPAAIGAIILATMPFHLFFSRNALNNITDPTTIVLAILLLTRSSRFDQRGNAIMCGMVLGFGFYGYYGGRAIPIVVLVLLPLLAVIRRIGIGSILQVGAWIATGFLATAMPLLMVYRNDPTPFAGHLSDVSTISLERLRDDPGTVMPLYIENIWDAVMLPWISNFYIFFNNDAPFLGWPVAVLLAIGVAVWLARAFQSRDIFGIACLVVPWAMLAAGVALTTPVGGHRLLVMTPLWALAAGAGLFAVARWLAHVLRPMAGSVFRIVIVVTLLAMSISDLRWSASEERQRNYIDYRTILAWDMGWRLSRHDHDPDATPAVLFAGPPMMFSNGWGNLQFLAPDLQISDVNDPITEGSVAPPLPDDTVLILIGERASERCAAEQIYPDATMAEVRAWDGTLLYVAFYHEPLSGWSSTTTPAETTYSIVTESDCTT